MICVGGDVPPLEENAELLDFTPERVHLFFGEVYRYFPHHNDESHLDEGVADDAIWQRRWRRLAAKLASWYKTTLGAVGHHFRTILVVE